MFEYSRIIFSKRKAQIPMSGGGGRVSYGKDPDGSFIQDRLYVTLESHARTNL